MLLDSFQLFFKFNQKLALKIICITKTFKRQVCFCVTSALILVYDKLNYLVFYTDPLAHLLDCLVYYKTVARKN